MKALCRLDYQQYKTLEVPLPMSRDDNDVLIKVKCCTDTLSALGYDPYTWFPNTKPWVMGMEFSGIVERIGPGAVGYDLKVGDRVTSFYRITCGKCSACRSGQESPVV